MGKELITNITPIVNKSVADIVASNPDINSLITLYDWNSRNKYIFVNETVELSDSIQNYDFLIVEGAAWNSNYVYINPSCIGKPMIKNLAEIANIKVGGYLLELFSDSTSHKRIIISFPTDKSILVENGENSGVPYSIGVRNIYGVKLKSAGSAAYSAEEMPVGLWVDGKTTVYRSTVDLGLISIPNGSASFPHGISGIDKIVSYQIYLSASGGTWTLPYIEANSKCYAIMNADGMHTRSNSEWRNYTCHAIIDYTKV